MNYRVLIWLLLGITACSRSSLDQVKLGKIKFKPNTEEQPVKVGAFGNPVVETRKSITHFKDAYELQYCIELELTEDSALAEVTEYLVHHDQIYVYDRIQRDIFVFDLYGRFLGPLAPKGQGPGEYENPNSIQPWGEHVAVTASGRSNLMIFNSQRQLVQEYALQKLAILLNDRVLLHDEKVIVPSFPSMTNKTPAHAVLDIKNASEPKVLYGFGKRPPHLFRRDGTRNRKFYFRSLKDFYEIECYWWKTKTYSSLIEIYDSQGHEITQLKPGFDGLKQDMLIGMKDQSDVRAYMANKAVAHHISHAGPYVLVTYLHSGVKANLFDTKGNLLTHNLNFDRLPLMFMQNIGSKEHIGFALPVDEFHWEYALETTLGDDFYGLVDAGYDPAKREDYNPWLFIYKPLLKTKLSDMRE